MNTNTNNLQKNAAIAGDSANTFDGMKFEFRISHLKTIGILNVILTNVWYQQLPTRMNVAVWIMPSDFE
mgnify:CR=1 FL=1